MLKNKVVNRSIIVLLSVVICTAISCGYCKFIYKQKYSVKMNLMFNLHTKYDWNSISQRYENIINLTNTKEKEEGFISNALNDAGVNGEIKNVTIEPSVISRQINITYKAKNLDNGIKVVEAIGNSIIKQNGEYVPTKMVYLKKQITVSEDDIRIDKRLDVLIFAVCGLAIGLGIVMIMEGKWRLEKK
ncbi:hypothetical protein [uncultured Clostridium sp.]|uniref:hypothetical protein n=1 Tax=uncultured Clostridium sp. TaxID=59620 RepID=UPI002633FDDC|nr:hypothetical protein [uncultured Clostridium sp.]